MPGNGTGDIMPARTVLHVFSTLNVGGPQVRFATIANKLGDRFRHLLFAMDHGYESTKLLTPEASCEVHDVSYEKGRAVRNFFTFRRALRELRPDVLVTYNWGAIEWALANLGRATPHIHIVDGFGPEEADQQLPRRVQFRRLALRRNTKVLVPSLTLQEIVTNTWRLDPTTVTYVPNGIDCERFTLPRDNELALRFNIDPAATVIGTVAALRAEKNLQRLLQAFKAVSEDKSLHLVIVGDGTERPMLEGSAADMGLAERVTFTGYLSDPAPILSLFDIFALSSDTEQMPISVLEAMASGLPIAGVNVGDVRHIVSEANKPHIVARDADALASVLSDFAADPDLRQRIGGQNRDHVKTVYDEATMVDAYARLFSA